MRILLIVDMQDDPLFPGDHNLANRISLISQDYDLVIATRDFHPGNHCSFKGYGGSFPPHCVRGSVGARLFRNIDMCADIIISKGMAAEKEAFSAFSGTHLANMLRGLKHTFQNPDGSRGSTDLTIDVVGVATEFCIRETVLDAKVLGFKVRVLQELIRGIDAIDAGETLEEFREAGIEVV